MFHKRLAVLVAVLLALAAGCYGRPRWVDAPRETHQDRSWEVTIVGRTGAPSGGVGHRDPQVDGARYGWFGSSDQSGSSQWTGSNARSGWTSGSSPHESPFGSHSGRKYDQSTPFRSGWASGASLHGDQHEASEGWSIKSHSNQDDSAKIYGLHGSIGTVPKPVGGINTFGHDIHSSVPVQGWGRHQEVHDDSHDSHSSVPVQGWGRHQEVHDDSHDSHSSVPVKGWGRHQEVHDDSHDSHSSVPVKGWSRHQEVHDDSHDSNVPVKGWDRVQKLHESDVEVHHGVDVLAHRGNQPTARGHYELVEDLHQPKAQEYYGRRHF